MFRFFQAFLLAVLIVCLPFKNSRAQTIGHDADSILVAYRLSGFVDSFSNLQWDKFTGFFADDATAFFPPSANFPYRANNKIEIEKIFKSFFDVMRARKSSPPYLEIIPKDLRIQTLNTVAVVSFTLEDPGMLGRRTIVLEKRNENWFIVHLHASGVAMKN
jgi:hypothetical protein